MDIQTWMQRLPKAEHHLHIEGTITWEMAREVQGDALPEQPEWAVPGFQFNDFTDFGNAMRLCYGQVLIDLEDYHRVAQRHFQQLAQQNVRYLETSFALGIAYERAYPFADVVRAIRSAAPKNMTVCVFGAFYRGVMLPDETIQDILNTPDLAGIDLHGDERIECDFEHFAEIYDEARRLGLRTKAHAGEICDSSSVKEVLEKLQPQRIQHGVTAAKDTEALNLLAERQIILDMCPTSNVMLRVVPDIQSYPVRRFLDYGIEFTINTDDPGVFGCTLSGELQSLVEYDLMSLEEIARLQRDAFARADIDESTRQSIDSEISELIAELET